MIRRRVLHLIVIATMCVPAVVVRGFGNRGVPAMTSQASSSPQLYQTWLHSHEEDTATETIYRPSSYAFPPSRGRMGFTLNADGTCVSIGINPRDGSQKKNCNWTRSGGDPGEIT